MKLIYALGLTVLMMLTASAVSYAQSEETESGAAEETAPAAEQGGPVINVEQKPYEYYYWPDEDLDSFGLSTMGEDSGGSTLGKTPRRKSNIEANPPKPAATPEPEEEPEAPSDEAVDTGAEESPAGMETGSETGASGAAFYKWVDEKGNLHITNNIGDVPLEYQQKIYQQKTGSEE